MFGGGRIFNSTTLAVWTRQIAGLVSSGLPLERALTALTDEAETETQRNLVASLRAEVNAGAPFGRALSQHPREFSPIYVAVIGAGEQSGNLGLVLERLADDLEQRQALQQKLVGAALYPAIVTLVAIVHRDLPGQLRGAAGGQRLRRHQARAADPHGGDAGARAPSCATTAG